MTTPTAAAIRAAEVALSRAEIHDDRVTSDRHRIRVWADTITPHNIDDTAIVCRAVDAHYATPGADTIKVGDLITAYRRLRAERGERDKGDQLHSLPASGAIATPDPQLGDLPIGGATGTPVWHAYEHAYNAIAYACPTCGAEPQEACILVAPDREQPLARKAPCVARVREGIRAGDDYRETCQEIPPPLID